MKTETRDSVVLGLVLVLMLLCHWTADHRKVIDLTAGVDQPDLERCHRPDPELLVAAVPGCQWTDREMPGHPEAFLYNREGVRSPDYPPRAPPGRVRVLLVGGAQIAAPGLPAPQTPSGQLEGRLREAGYDVEVINGGTLFYGSDQTARFLTRLLEAYHPAIVLYDVEPPLFMADKLFDGTTVDGPALAKAGWEPALARFGLTAKYFLRRWLAAWEAWAIPGRKKSLRFLSQETVASLRRAKEAAERSGAKIWFLFPDRSPINLITGVSFPFEFSLADLIDAFTPHLHFPGGLFLSELKGEGLAALPVSIPSHEDGNFYFPGGVLLTGKGSAFFINELFNQREHFLPAPPVSARPPGRIHRAAGGRHAP